MLSEAKQQLLRRLGALESYAETLCQLPEDVDARRLRRLSPQIMVGIVVDHREGILSGPCSTGQMLSCSHHCIDIFRPGNLLNDGACRSSAFDLGSGGHGESS